MTIHQGDTFTVKHGSRVDSFRRETDDPAPMFASTRIRVTHLSCSDDLKLKQYTFGTEPEWFRQRGLSAG